MGGLYEHKSQSLLSKTKNSEEGLQYNIYKNKTPEIHLYKNSKINIMAEKFDANYSVKAKADKSLNDSKNFIRIKNSNAPAFFLWTQA